MTIGLTFMLLGIVLVGCGLVVSMADEPDDLPEIEPLDDNTTDLQY